MHPDDQAALEREAFWSHEAQLKEYAREHGKINPQQAWILTPYDTWERNPAYNGPTQPHPESGERPVKEAVALTKEAFRARLERSDEWVKRAVSAIYKYQTDQEKNDGMTQNDNGVGFNGPDSIILSSYAKQISERGFLSPKQIVIARRKILKYAGQLVKIAKEKADKQ